MVESIKKCNLQHQPKEILLPDGNTVQQNLDNGVNAVYLSTIPSDAKCFSASSFMTDGHIISLVLYISVPICKKINYRKNILVSF
jgi:hypothetical protein